MKEIEQEQLRKALAFKYWTVEKFLYYMVTVDPTSIEKYYLQNGLAVNDITNGDFENYSRQIAKHNEDSQNKIFMRHEELKAYWNDTDHVVQPRNNDTNPKDNCAEFPVAYFIEWALGRGIEIYWLNWANEEQLLLKIKGPQSMAASKGGQARALLYQGAREACREGAKAFRKDKKGDEKLSLDDCARVISEGRDDFEATHNVKLPAERTIRGYLTNLS